MNRTISVFLEDRKAYISSGIFRHGEFYIDKINEINMDSMNTDYLEDYLKENYKWNVFDNLNISVGSDKLILEEDTDIHEFESEEEYRELIEEKYESEFLVRSMIFERENFQKKVYVSIKKDFVESYRELSDTLRLRAKYFSPHFSKLAEYSRDRRKSSEAVIYFAEGRTDVSIYEDREMVFFKSYDSDSIDSPVGLIKYFGMEILQRPIDRLFFYGRDLSESEEKLLKDSNIDAYDILDSGFMKIKADREIIKALKENPKYINSVISLY